MNTLQDALQVTDAVPLNLLLSLGRQSLRQALQVDGSISQHTVKDLWQKLQSTACNSSVRDKHLTAACNALCVLLQYTHVSKDVEVRTFALSREVWDSTFAVAQKAFADGKHKPALQVLDILILLLHENSDKEAVTQTLHDTLKETLTILLTEQPKSRLKEVCIILSCFLRRACDIVPFSTYLAIVSAIDRQPFQQRCMQHKLGWKDFDAHQEPPAAILFMALLFTIQITEPRTAALKLFSHLCSVGEKHDYSDNVAVASRIIQIYFNANDECLEDASTMLFPAIMVDQLQFKLFLDQHCPDRASFGRAIPVYLAVLQVGRDKSFISEAQLSEILEQIFENTKIPGGAMNYITSFFDILFTDLRPSIRLQAYKLLTSSTSPSHPITEDILACLIKNMACVHNDSDAYYRDEFIGTSRRFLKRIERSAHIAWKGQADESHASNLLLNQYDHFLAQYTTFLISEISPQASYPRHILALHILAQLFDLALAPGPWMTWVSVLKDSIRPLLSLILDPFDDVRRMSASVLQRLRLKYHDEMQDDLVSSQILHRTASLAARSNRGDHADALGRLYSLKADLAQPNRLDSVPSEKGIQTTGLLGDMIKSVQAHLNAQNCVDPAGSFPLHGTLLGLVYILEQTRMVEPQVAENIYDLCESIWQFVRDELCVDSPERATEVEAREDSIGPKDLLAFSWRALRDSSLVVQALLRQCTSENNIPLCRRFGSLCLDQLINLRHRGAFSTVAQTFTLCCQCTRSATGSGTTAANEIIEQWRIVAFQELDKQASRLTRRSAGLPAIFCGLLDSGDKIRFKLMVDQLMQIASSQPEFLLNGPDQISHPKLPQVHALNCLKDIMTNSRFRIISEAMVVQMLNLAAITIASDIWAIRNCGLMLLRACISRLAPNSPEAESDHAARHDDLNIDTPLRLASNLLSISAVEKFSESSTNSEKLSETVFAALDLLSRISIQPHASGMVNAHVESQFQNRLWAVREHAARLRAARVENGNEIATIQHLLQLATGNSSPNSLHASLLCVRLLFQHIWSQENVIDEDAAVRVVKILQSLYVDVLAQNPSKICLSTYVEVLNDLYSSGGGYGHLYEKLGGLASMFVEDVEVHSLERSDALLRRAVLLNKLYRYLQQSDAHLDTYTNQTPLPNTSIQQFAWPIEDADAITYVLERFRSATNSPSRIVRVILELLQQTQEEDHTALSMRIISEQLVRDSALLSEPDIQTLSSIVKLDASISRHRFNAEILLTARFVVIPSFQDRCRNARKLWRKLLNAIQEAFTDEIEFSSRITAVVSVGHLISNGYSIVDRASEERYLRLSLMVYHMLNDDDDEIRHLAASFVGDIVHQDSKSPPMITPCAAAARSYLMRHIADKFGHLPQFSAHALCRVSGAQQYVALDDFYSLFAHCRTKSVRSQVDAAIQRSNDLFAEEKQNLYVDEIAELQTWISVVHLINIDDTTSRAVREIGCWVNEGLMCLLSLLENKDTDQNEANLSPLGPTYHEEILIIFLRVFGLAKILLIFQSTTADGAELFSVEHFHKLKDVCHRQRVHHSIIEAFEADGGRPTRLQSQVLP